MASSVDPMFLMYDVAYMRCISEICPCSGVNAAIARNMAVTTLESKNVSFQHHEFPIYTTTKIRWHFLDREPTWVINPRAAIFDK